MSNSTYNSLLADIHALKAQLYDLQDSFTPLLTLHSLSQASLPHQHFCFVPVHRLHNCKFLRVLDANTLLFQNPDKFYNPTLKIGILNGKNFKFNKIFLTEEQLIAQLLPYPHVWFWGIRGLGKRRLFLLLMLLLIQDLEAEDCSLVIEVDQFYLKKGLANQHRVFQVETDHSQLGTTLQELVRALDHPPIHNQSWERVRRLEWACFSGQTVKKGCLWTADVGVESLKMQEAIRSQSKSAHVWCLTGLTRDKDQIGTTLNLYKRHRQFI